MKPTCNGCQQDLSRIKVNPYGRRECPRCHRMNRSASLNQIRRADARAQYFAAPYLYD